MDRRLGYIGAIPQDLDMLVPQRNAMKALGWLAEGVLGWNTLVDGLSCLPTTPASLAVQITAGQIFQQQAVDPSAFGSMAADITHNIIKQGVVEDTTTYTLTPPGTSGYAMNYLVQAQILEQDLNATVVPYFNPASLSNPNAVAWSGPNNSGVAQPLARQCTVVLSLKPGTAAPAGTQVTPAPDAGYVGLYQITVAQGQTQITANSISQVDNAPFIWLKLPQIPLWVQGGTYAWATDTSAVANNIQVTLNPLPAQIQAGFGIRVKVANANTGASTITINRNTLSSLGPYAVVRATGSVLLSGDIAAGQVIDLVFDGTSFRDITGTTTNTAVGALTAQSGEGIYVDGTAHVNLNYPGLSSGVPLDPDLFSFFSQADTHHRAITWAAMKLLLASSSGLFKGIAVIRNSSTWVKPAGVNSVLAFATAGGGAGGGASGTSVSAGKCSGAGGGAGGTALDFIPLAGVSSVICVVGKGGLGVAGASGAPGGATSFGSYLAADGGLGGGGPDAPDPAKDGGLGGAGTLGALLLRGGAGENLDDASDKCGKGGASFWGGGGRGASAYGYIGPGQSGTLGGGGGGGDNDARGASIKGGDGGDGVIFLLMFS